MVKVTIFLEGGGGSAIECRRAFAKLFQDAGLRRPNFPAIIACGSRNEAYKQFCNEWQVRSDRSLLLLVDSETRVNGTKWDHVARRPGDQWKSPTGATEDHLWFMMQCMETWVAADRVTLSTVFRDCLTENALPPLVDLEKRSKDDVQTRLQRATARCPRDRKYEKGRRSYQVVEQLKSDALSANLPHFQSLIAHLKHLLP
ncbi:MAG TPA: DUF4276 family protein [Armatimonadota bacterium]|nr:DUF4276 family protein [Armatimonadota bacterium]